MDTMIHIRSLVRAGPLGRPARYAALKVRGGFDPPSGEGPGSRMLRPRRERGLHLPYGSRGDVHPLGPDNGLPRKEVIQPHLPVRLPCYDFTPLTLHTYGASLLAVGPATSGADDSGGVTGGVYKARERIHRGMMIRDY